jgi:hypothetical protein
MRGRRQKEATARTTRQREAVLAAMPGGAVPHLRRDCLTGPHLRRDRKRAHPRRDVAGIPAAGASDNEEEDEEMAAPPGFEVACSICERSEAREPNSRSAR